MIWSHPSRVCGLKYLGRVHTYKRLRVTPFTGVWIEIPTVPTNPSPYMVTPFTGVWIEIRAQSYYSRGSASHPSRVCGLKLNYQPC